MCLAKEIYNYSFSDYDTSVKSAFNATKNAVMCSSELASLCNDPKPR